VTDLRCWMSGLLPAAGDKSNKKGMQ